MGLLLASVPICTRVPRVTLPPFTQFSPAPSQTLNLTVFWLVPVTTAVKFPISVIRPGAAVGVSVNFTPAAAPSGRTHTAAISKKGLLLDIRHPRRARNFAPRRASRERPEGPRQYLTFYQPPTLKSSAAPTVVQTWP